MKLNNMAMYLLGVLLFLVLIIAISPWFLLGATVWVIIYISKMVDLSLSFKGFEVWDYIFKNKKED